MNFKELGFLGLKLAYTQLLIVGSELPSPLRVWPLSKLQELFPLQPLNDV